MMENPYEIGVEALKDWETEPYGDLRLNANRATAKVLTALGKNRLMVVSSIDMILMFNDYEGAKDRLRGQLEAFLAVPEPEGPPMVVTEEDAAQEPARSSEILASHRDDESRGDA